MFRRQEEVILTAISWLARDDSFAIEPVHSISLVSQQLECCKGGRFGIVRVRVDLDQHGGMPGPNRLQGASQYGQLMIVGIALYETDLRSRTPVCKKTVKRPALDLKLTPFRIRGLGLDPRVVPALLTPTVGGNDHRFRFVAIRQSEIQTFNIRQFQLTHVIRQELKGLRYRLEGVNLAVRPDSFCQEPHVRT